MGKAKGRMSERDNRERCDGKRGDVGGSVDKRREEGGGRGREISPQREGRGEGVKADSEINGGGGLVREAEAGNISRLWLAEDEA